MSGFSYQGGFASPTEAVDAKKLHELFGSQQTRWLVDKYREIMADVQNTARWTADRDYQEWLRRERKPAADQQKRVEQWAASLKKRLPAVMFQATFDETTSKKGFVGRWRKQAATRLTGLVVMDIDHISSDELRVKREEFTAADFAERAKLLGIVFIYITPSGHGLKVVFKARTEWGNLIDNQLQMARLLGVVVDESCKDASRMSFVAREEDILFINERELFEYENKEFAEKYNEEYRLGHSQPTADSTERGAAGADVSAVNTDKAGGAGDTVVAGGGRVDAVGDRVEAGENRLTLWGHPVQEYIDALYAGHLPSAADKNRHASSLTLAYDLLLMLDGDRKATEQLLRAQRWVQEIVDERNEDVEQTVKSAAERIGERERKGTPYPSRAMQQAIERVSGQSYRSLRTAAKGASAAADAQPLGTLPLAEWGARIREMQQDFPCLRELCHGRDDASLAAVLFAAAAMMGTLMTRTWYHFYHRPEERRRLNYSIYVIGDPGCGKSFAEDLVDVLMAPILASDQVGYDALNRWKREKNERQSSSKEQKKDALKKPEVIIRIHPSRTANGVFIEDMQNAVEQVGQDLLHLHLFTFDAELDNNTKLSGGGTWIDKQALELKAFHNEKDGQAYANQDSVMGMFRVYWNFVYTGTALALRRKITQQNFGSGLSTRLAVIPMPSSNFRMMPIDGQQRQAGEARQVLSEWAYRLDKVQGELPLWPLVKECWEWTRDHMALAEVNDDKADELLLKRVAYYGIAISTPFILMRHWQQWQDRQTFDIDERDLDLCRLALDIQYATQHHYFGEYAQSYFADMERDPSIERKRHKKTIAAYNAMPDEFTADDVVKFYSMGNNSSARCIISRLIKDGYAERFEKGKFRKLKKTM